MTARSLPPPHHEDDQPRRREATAVIYADIRGFTATLDRLETDAESTVKMKGYLAAWQQLRDALVRHPSGATKGFYLANRVGDAFVILVFTHDAKRWHEYITAFLVERFQEFSTSVKLLDAQSDPHLKVSLYTGENKKVVYYETAVMKDELVRGFTIARRDFLCTAINKCARMDALEEADLSRYLCNGAAQRFLLSEAEGGGALNAAMFRSLGPRSFRGFREPEEVFACVEATVVKGGDHAG